MSTRKLTPDARSKILKRGDKEVEGGPATSEFTGDRLWCFPDEASSRSRVAHTSWLLHQNSYGRSRKLHGSLMMRSQEQTPDILPNAGWQMVLKKTFGVRMALKKAVGVSVALGPNLGQQMLSEHLLTAYSDQRFRRAHADWSPSHGIP